MNCNGCNMYLGDGTTMDLSLCRNIGIVLCRRCTDHMGDFSDWLSDICCPVDNNPIVEKKARKTHLRIIRKDQGSDT